MEIACGVIESRPHAGDHEPAADTLGDDPAAGIQDLPKELAAVDELLDDPAFFEPSERTFAAARTPVDPDRDLSADDVPQAPLPAGVRDVVPGGR